MAAPPVQAHVRRDPESTRKLIGWITYGVLFAVGAFLLFALFILAPLFDPDPGSQYYYMGIGALWAMPLLLVYLWVPWIVDRYDPEPTWALLTVLAWGGIAACGFSAAINTAIGSTAAMLGGKDFGSFVGACFSAPLVEEFWKGFAVFWMFYFRKRDFDGIVDGVIYGAFVALGFAAVENIIYYGRAIEAEDVKGAQDALLGTVLVRGVLAPWGHPLYTAMTGIGFGLARESNKGWVKWLGPIGGYFLAVFLHFVWNLAATIHSALVLIMLPLWFLFVLAFAGLVVWCVRRKGIIIRDHLKDEVLMGNLTQAELDMVASPIGRIRATFSFGGATGRKFVDSAARLALSKWHTGRATQGRKATISADFVVPLRQDLHKIRAEVSRALGRQVPQPQVWMPPPSPYAQQHQQQQQQHPHVHPPGPPGGYNPQGGGGGGYGGGGGGYGPR